ncbi:MAG: hypothetical protein CL799_13705 [Chromatiales bacterium]|nr:hypothetical protein [Chromatiales bacterium]
MLPYQATQVPSQKCFASVVGRGLPLALAVLLIASDAGSGQCTRLFGDQWGVGVVALCNGKSTPLEVHATTAVPRWR